MQFQILHQNKIQELQKVFFCIVFITILFWCFSIDLTNIRSIVGDLNIGTTDFMNNQCCDNPKLEVWILTKKLYQGLSTKENWKTMINLIFWLRLFFVLASLAFLFFLFWHVRSTIWAPPRWLGRVKTKNKNARDTKKQNNLSQKIKIR